MIKIYEDRITGRRVIKPIGATIPPVDNQIAPLGPQIRAYKLQAVRGPGKRIYFRKKYHKNVNEEKKLISSFTDTNGHEWHLHDNGQYHSIGKVNKNKNEQDPRLYLDVKVGKGPYIKSKWDEMKKSDDQQKRFKQTRNKKMNIDEAKRAKKVKTSNTDQVLSAASGYGYEHYEVPDYMKYNHEVGSKVIHVTHTPEDADYEKDVARTSTKEDAAREILHHAKKHEPEFHKKYGHLKINEEKIVNEKLTYSDPASKWIDDFVNSDNPRFAGKSKKERIKMALGAKYAAKPK